MKKQFLFMSVFFFLNSYSQINFEKGYFIDNSNQKVECLIKNRDWKDNPIKFEYKFSGGIEVLTATIKSIKEFGIYNSSKFIRSKVNIDRSSENYTYMSNKRQPIFNEEELFLKVLVEAKASLYHYIDGNIERFFYSIDNSTKKQLVFKAYKDSNENIRHNNKYKQQLWKDLKCPKFKKNDVESLQYNTKKLTNYFVKYNECNSENIVKYIATERKELFKMSIKPHINSTSLKLWNYGNFDINFENKQTFGIGVEFEYVLPFNKNKWSIVFEPNYKYYKAISLDTVTFYKPIFWGDILIGTVAQHTSPRVEIQSIEAPVGVRYYSYLNPKSKLFVNVLLDIDFSLGSTIKFINENGDNLATREFKEINMNIAGGLGYSYNDKYSLEFRVQPNTDVLLQKSTYSTVSAIFGYSLF